MLLLLIIILKKIQKNLQMIDLIKEQKELFKNQIIDYLNDEIDFASDDPMIGYPYRARDVR